MGERLVCSSILPTAVWAAVGQAPNGQPNPNGVKFGAALGANGGRASVGVDDHALVSGIPLPFRGLT
jgi:hypothetical protein